MKKKWRSWLVLAVPYLLTALIPVISVLFLANTILTNYQANSVAEKQTTLQAAADRMQQKCNTIEQLTVLLSNTNALNRYSTACLNRTAHTSTEFLELQNLFYNASFDPVIYEIFLYDKKDDTAVSSDVALSSTEMFFRYNYVLDGRSFQENMDRLDNMPKDQRYCPEITLSSATLAESTKQVVEYRMFLPVNWVRDMQCQLVVAMDAEILFGDLRDAVPPEGEFYVYDSNNVLIYSHGSTYRDWMPLTDHNTLHPLSGEDTSLHGAVLRCGQWKIKVYIPNLINGSERLSFQAPSFIVFVILPMILCVLLALAFTTKNFRGVQDLLGLFHGHTYDHSGEPEIMDYRLVRRYVSQVIAEKSQMTQQIIQYSDSRKYEVLDKLVRNTYNSREEAAHALEEAALNIREGRNIVLCIRCPELSYETVLSNGTTVRDTMRQLFGELLEHPYVLFDTATNETTCIISLEEGENPDFLIQGIISQLNVELAYRYDIEVNIGVGNPAPSVFSLHESYAQAHRVLHYSEAFGSKVNLFAELQRMEDAYYYPREYSERISDYIIAGKHADAKHLIRQVYEENFENPEKLLSEKAVGKLKQQLWDCVHTLSETYSVPIDKKLSPQSAPRLFFDALTASVELLSEEIQKTQTQVRHKTASRLLDYIQENYCNSNLTVKQLSAEFGMHENYISNVFKNAMGENLSVYIERLRIEKAQDMIKNTDMMIRDIAEAVGYISDTSFRRAFKKITGQTPGECRK